MDVVEACSDLFPSDEGYFAADGTGVASNDNAITGDFLQVDPEEDFARGETAVHLVADPDYFSDGDRTFYGPWIGSSGADARTPLSSRHGVRFVAGGGFDGGTDLVVWKAPRRLPEGPIDCGPASPGWLTNFEDKLVFDEEENVAALDEEMPETVFRLAAQKVPTTDLFPPSVGWMDLGLGVQSWVGAVMSAEERYSVGFSSWRMDDLCTDEPTPAPPARR